MDGRARGHAEATGSRPGWQLELRNITAGYAGSTVLRDISMQVPKGSIVALLGANGAGKTTTLRTIAGIVRPSRGSVILDDVDVTSLPPYRRVHSGLCLIPQGRGIFPRPTVPETLPLYLPLTTASTELFERVLVTFPELQTPPRAPADQPSGRQ